MSMLEQKVEYLEKQLSRLLGASSFRVNEARKKCEPKFKVYASVGEADWKDIEEIMKILTNKTGVKWGIGDVVRGIIREHFSNNCVAPICDALIQNKDEYLLRSARKK